MSRCDIPKAQWERIKADPNAWRLRYLEYGIILGNPAYLQGTNQVEDYASCNHIMFDHPTLNTIQARQQGSNPLEVAIGDDSPPVWKPILQQPYYGPVDDQGNAVKPIFPPDSFWSQFN